MENKKDIKNILKKIEINQYELFIFDFDGTIVESLPIDWVKIKKELGALLKINSGDKWTLEKLLSKVKKTRGEKGIKRAYEILNQYEGRGVPRARLRKPVARFIQKIPKHQKKAAIFSTNMKKTIEAILKKFKLCQKFDLIISKEDVEHYKPNPQGLILILKKLRVAPAEALFLGDKKTDLISGKKAGIETILITEKRSLI